MRWLPFMLVACGARTDLGGQRADASALPVTELQGVVVNDCAPNDGPAIAFALAQPGAAVVPTCANSVVSALSVRISLWIDIPKAPGTFSFAGGGGAVVTGGVAVVCPAKGQCVAANAGVLTLTVFDQTSASGFFSLDMPDSTTVTGNFTAIPLCHNVAGCG